MRAIKVHYKPTKGGLSVESQPELLEWPPLSNDKWHVQDLRIPQSPVWFAKTKDFGGFSTTSIGGQSPVVSGVPKIGMMIMYCGSA